MLGRCNRVESHASSHVDPCYWRSSRRPRDAIVARLQRHSFPVSPFTRPRSDETRFRSAGIIHSMTITRPLTVDQLAKFPTTRDNSLFLGPVVSYPPGSTRACTRRRRRPRRPRRRTNAHGPNRVHTDAVPLGVAARNESASWRRRPTHAPRFHCEPRRGRVTRRPLLLDALEHRLAPAGATVQECSRCRRVSCHAALAHTAIRSLRAS